MCKRAGGDKRGSAASRRARKLWMLVQPQWQDETTEPGATCLCAHCKTVVNFETVEADRVIPGGPYARWNVQPSCKPCNLSRSDKTDWTGPEARSAACLALAK